MLGWVWQAEEVERAGRWHRYFGFVGVRGEAAQVPANEIEFPTDGDWAELSLSIDIRVELCGGRDANMAEKPLRVYHNREPVVVRLWLRNRSGEWRHIPGWYYWRVMKISGIELAGLEPAGPALRSGFNPEVEFAPMASLPREERELAVAEYQQLKPLRRARFIPSEAGRSLRPLEEHLGLEFPLGDWFDLTRPGIYRLRFRITASSDIGEGLSRDLLFFAQPSQAQG